MRWRGQTGDDSYIQNFGGRTLGKETTWKVNAKMEG
jgi:hypothetical protein